MRVKYKNKSSKKISEDSVKKLKDFCKSIAIEMGLDKSGIKIIYLYYIDEGSEYLPIGKPMYCFHKLLNDNCIRIDLEQTYQRLRKEFIVHELTHVKQIIDGMLKVSYDLKNVKWNKRKVTAWKKINFRSCPKKYDEEIMKYNLKFLPWESEVVENIKKFTK